MAKYGMAIDLHRCTGCGACAFACKNENNTEIEKNGKRYNWADFLIKTEGTFAQGNIKYQVFPTLCNHCTNAPCIETCPVSPKALYKTDDGVTMLKHEICIGCGMCINACPYSDLNLTSAGVQYSVITQNARWFQDDEVHAFWNDDTVLVPGCTSSPAEVVSLVGQKPPQANLYYHPDSNDIRPKDTCEKCTFCDHRVTQGLLPSCVEACPTHARMFGDLNDSGSEINAWLDKGYAKLKDNKGELIAGSAHYDIEPNVFYIGDFGPLSIEEHRKPKTPAAMKIYPNPAKTVITIDVENEVVRDGMLTVFDTSGREVISMVTNEQFFVGKNSFNVNVAPLKPGTYIVRLVAGDKVFSANLIISR